MAVDKLKQLQLKRKALEDAKVDRQKKQDDLDNLLGSITEKDLESLLAPLDAQLVKLDEQRKKLIADKRAIKKQYAPPRKGGSNGGNWKTEIEKKGKDTMLTVTHTACTKAFEKTVNGDPEKKRQAYLTMRNAFIEHFKDAVSKKAAESYLTNTVRPQLGIA